jgi:hypothetical protein
VLVDPVSVMLKRWAGAEGMVGGADEPEKHFERGVGDGLAMVKSRTRREGKVAGGILKGFL